MITITRHSPRRAHAGTWATLLLLSMTCCRSEDEKNSTVLSDPVRRDYPRSFVRMLEKLESSDPGNFPETEPGKLEVALGAKGQQYRVRLDTSQQVFHLSMPEDVVDSWRRRPGLQAGGDGKLFPPLAASMAKADISNNFHSASALAFKAKQFDDGLYAAVEFAADQGVGHFASRRKLLADLAAALKAGEGGPGTDQALGFLGAATRRTEHAVEVPPAAAAIAAGIETEFLADPFRSKPLGFYTWSRDLVGVFQRDRLLQAKLEPAAASAFAAVLGRDADLLTRYRAGLRLPARLTNGLACEALDQVAGEVAIGRTPALENLALFPASRAYETDLVKKLYGNAPIPDGFDLADEMVRRIQKGQLNLQPGEDSGWYDYQTWALEPLVVPERMPEARHLQFDGAYRKELAKLFKSLLALTRETHVKQLETPRVGAAFSSGFVLEVSPQLTQEPLASFYLRRALAYRFVHGVLVDSFGEDGLVEMTRLTAAGPMNLTLDRELRIMEALFYGAYLNTVHELGMAPEKQPGLGLGEAGSLSLYRDWSPREDRDVSVDMRMMVPVFYDVERRKTKVWVVLGVTTRPLHVRYETAPVLQSVVDTKGNPVDLAKVKVQFERSKFAVAYPVMAELYVTRILDREEFRALCDKYRTREAILAHLE